MAEGRLQGTRLDDGPHDYADVNPGDYWLPDPESPEVWWFRDPFGSFGRITTHRVEVNENRTITVSPSIAPRPDDPPDAFHGWLTGGVWTW